jgi:hypothetical protein
MGAMLTFASVALCGSLLIDNFLSQQRELLPPNARRQARPLLGVVMRRCSQTETPAATLPIRVDLPESCFHLDQQS